MKIRAIAIVLLLLFTACQKDAGIEKGFQFKEDKKLQQIKGKKPLNIQLKRNAKGSYSWVIKGDDVDRIIEVDDRLREKIPDN